MRACTLVLSILLVPASSALGQAGTSSLDALRRELGRGDAISIVREGGESLTGRLLRIGDRDLDIRIAGPRGRDLTILLDDIQSLATPALRHRIRMNIEQKAISAGA